MNKITRYIYVDYKNMILIYKVRIFVSSTPFYYLHSYSMEAYKAEYIVKSELSPSMSKGRRLLYSKQVLL
jgi:hypothetical protein